MAEPLRAALERAVGLSLPPLIRRSLRRGLRGVWACGDWAPLAAPSAGAGRGMVVAANHHSWWDAYLVWYAGRRLGRAVAGVMADEQLERFPFFRHQGALGRSELRRAIGRAACGDLLFIFPEGRLRPPGPVAEARPGFAFIAERAGVPVRPLAIRVAMRGAQHPEAFLALGPPLGPSASREAATEGFREAASRLLAGIDRALAESDPEAPPGGFEAWLEGAGSAHERLAGPSRLLRRWRG